MQCEILTGDTALYVPHRCVDCTQWIKTKGQGMKCPYFDSFIMMTLFDQNQHQQVGKRRRVV